MSNEEKQKSDNTEMGLGDHIAAYHKALLEKNPLVISVAIILSMMHLSSVRFSELIPSVVICYIISFYAAPALCNANRSESSLSDDEMRQLSGLDIADQNPFNRSISKEGKHGFGYNLHDPTNPMNLSNPLSPLSALNQSSLNIKR